MTAQSAVILYDVVDRSVKKAHLEVLIGHKQMANSITKLNMDEISQNQDSFKLDLGKCKDLKGKVLSLFTTIVDINPKNNRISMSIKLTGGKKVHEQVIIDASVQKNGDTAIAMATIIFI